LLHGVEQKLSACSICPAAADVAKKVCGIVIAGDTRPARAESADRHARFARIET